jgi:hypothetical protein
MGGPRLTAEEVEKRQKENKENLYCSKNKTTFNNQEVKELLEHLPIL